MSRLGTFDKWYLDPNETKSQETFCKKNLIFSFKYLKFKSRKNLLEKVKALPLFKKNIQFYKKILKIQQQHFHVSPSH
jgi:hypothetical protein